MPCVSYRPARLRGGGGTLARLGQSSTISGKLEAVPIKVKLPPIVVIQQKESTESI